MASSSGGAGGSRRPPTPLPVALSCTCLPNVSPPTNKRDQSCLFWQTMDGPRKGREAHSAVETVERTYLGWPDTKVLFVSGVTRDQTKACSQSAVKVIVELFNASRPRARRCSGFGPECSLR